ncbi:MAG: 1-hydroxycarotenoid 3,4-desaturase CrtD [Flavobacteriia bacterium]|jgi:diapolycopene oxygenase
MKKALVVGSGIAGIASAIRLCVKGFDVSVYEANSYPGGKLTAIQIGDFHFDAGPSLFTMPQYVEELFEIAGKSCADYFEYVKHDTACHYFFEDGTFLPFKSDVNQVLKEVEDTLNVDSSSLKKHFQKSKFIYDKTHEAFLENSLHKTKNYFSKAVFKALTNSFRLNIFTTMHQANEKALNHPKLVQIFDRFATYNGSNPYQAPGILNIIPHLEHGFGTFFPTKGMHSITQSLVKLAEDLGVKFHFNSNVTEILHDSNKVTGIKIGEENILADLVICNADIRPAYRYLLPKLNIPKQVNKQEPSSSALIFYWGIDKVFPNLDLHNIFFSEDYKKEFDYIFEKKHVFSDPTVYVHISTKIVKNDAPEGKESWFVMVNVPSNAGQDWTQIRNETRKNVLQKLSRILGENIEDLILCEEFLDPIRIEERTSSFAGALYGASSNDRMAAFFRHPNFSKIKGLYFVGGSVHPGGGIPLCLLSAKIACAEVNS